MTGYEKYTNEMDSFRKSKLFIVKYRAMVEYFERNCKGRENVLCCDILCEDLDIESVQLRALVQHARRERVPISSCGDGYFLALDYGELKCTIDHMSERAGSIGFTISRLKACFPEEAQLEMFNE